MALELGPFHPERHAREAPQRPAVIMAGDRATVTYREVADRSAQLATLLRDAGLRPGGRIAMLMENHARFFEVCWAALRSGLYVTPVPTTLTADEASYIVRDAGASALVATVAQGEIAAAVARAMSPAPSVRLAIGGAIDGFEPYEGAIEACSPAALLNEPEGALLLYSSGTTGRPKGIQKPLSGRPAGSTHPLSPFLARIDLDADTVYLCPAPLYHAAAAGWSLGVQRCGGTVVLLERFDAEAALRAIAEHRVTLAQFVPTMLIRLLRLPAGIRAACDLSSLRRLLHAGAPCPPDVKAAMIDWLGPIVDEYYSGSEGGGITYITSAEWLAHRGSVGRPILGEVAIKDDEGSVLRAGQEGIIWFKGGERYEYRGDPVATAARQDRRDADGTWATLDDVGHVDDEGYLYLTDRRTDMIVSGGVNISPLEVENVLALHPRVDDVAVIGVPHPEYGEEVKALIKTAGPAPDVDLADELLAFCRARLSRQKCPRSVDFVDELPRLPTGKLAKHRLKERYWAGHATRVV